MLERARATKFRARENRGATRDESSRAPFAAPATEKKESERDTRGKKDRDGDARRALYIMHRTSRRALPGSISLLGNVKTKRDALGQATAVIMRMERVATDNENKTEDASVRPRAVRSFNSTNRAKRPPGIITGG